MQPWYISIGYIISWKQAYTVWKEFFSLNKWKELYGNVASLLSPLQGIFTIESFLLKHIINFFIGVDLGNLNTAQRMSRWDRTARKNKFYKGLQRQISKLKLSNQTSDDVKLHKYDIILLYNCLVFKFLWKMIDKNFFNYLGFCSFSCIHWFFYAQ